MGYNVNNIKNRGAVPTISNEVELFKLRKAIEKNAQHKGKDFEVVKQAYTDMEKFYGRQVPNSSCRSGCIHQMNKMLNNWFKLFDNSGRQEPKKEGSKTGSKTMNSLISPKAGDSLVSISDKREALAKEDYGVLLTRLKEELSPEQIREISKGKMMKKSLIVETLLNL